MVDPFSIATGTAGLLDVCWRVISYLREVQTSASKVEEEIASLLREVEALYVVNKAIDAVWAAEQKAIPGVSLANPDRVESLWCNVGTTLQDCRITVEKLEISVKEIIGKEGAKVASKLDGIRKQLRKQSKDGELHHLRARLANYQSSLNVLLAALNLSYTRKSRDTADNLSANVRQLGLKLQTEIADLQSKIASAESRELSDTLDSAEAIASLLPLNEHFYIPQRVSSIFTGREDKLQELKHDYDAAMSPGQANTQKRFVVYGLGGSGKTQFCCKFAQDNRHDFWGVFWIDARSHESAKHTFASIAKIGGVEPNDRAAKTWLSNHKRPWLLLIDNADDANIPVDSHFPEGESGFIIVTTRNPENKVHGNFGKRFYSFKGMGPTEANNLLLKAACINGPWSDPTMKSATEVAKTLGCLALALVHAGKAISSHLCSLETYLDFYERSWQRIRRARTFSGLNETENDTLNKNVYSSYEVIWEGFAAAGTEQSRDAIELLKLFAFFYCENIRVDMLTRAATNPRLERKHEEKEKKKEVDAANAKAKAWRQILKELGFGALDALLKDRSRPVLPAVLRDIEILAPFDEIRLRVALKELAQKALITYHQTIDGGSYSMDSPRGQQAATDSYSMHPLVHTWVRQRPHMSTGEQAIWCEAAMTTLAQCILIPPIGLEERQEYLQRDLLPHIIHVRKCHEAIRARLAENQKLRRRPWPVLAPQLGRRQAIRAAKFSLVYSQCGLWNEAEALQVVVKDFTCRKLGMEHPASRRISLLLAGTYWQQANTNKAGALQEQVLESCMRALGPDHHETLKVMDTLGASRCFQGRFKEAKEWHEKAIDGMTRTLGPEHEDTLIAVDNLGRVMWRYFRYGEARDLHWRAMTGMKRLLGSTHLHTLAAMENLAMAYLQIGRKELLEEAHQLMEEVLQEREKKLGREQPYTLLAICNLARIKSALGEETKAEQMIRAALPIAERNLGENHFGTLAGRAHLAQVLVRQGRYHEAEEIFIHVTEPQNYESASGDDGEHPDRILALWFLLNCYQLQGKIEHAISTCDGLVKSVNTIGGRGLGKGHTFAKQLAAKRDELEDLREASKEKPTQKLVEA